jgi:hypothetical protein
MDNVGASGTKNLMNLEFAQRVLDIDNVLTWKSVYQWLKMF